MNEFIDQFLIEGRELVSQGSDDLLALEERPDDQNRLDGAFRAFHTLKGAAGIVDFVAMAEVLHAGEDVLSAVRAGKTKMSAAVTDLCLACLDQVNIWLDQMQKTGEVPADAQSTANEVAKRFSLVTDVSPDVGQRIEDASQGAVETGIVSSWPAARQLLQEQILLLNDNRADSAAGRWSAASRVAVNVLRHLGSLPDAGNLERLAETALGTADPAPIAAAIAKLIDSPTAVRSALGSSGEVPLTDTTLRVDVKRIDALVKLAGELTVAKNALGHTARLARDETNPAKLAAALKTQHIHLERLISELQRSVVDLRVLPLQTAFQRFPRLVREMTVALGKPARLMIEGAATEADKSVVAAISEPLLHVIRNSLDHGLEDVSERSALGKSEIATIHLRAARQGEHIVIEVADDGRGLDLARIRAVAIERKVAPAEAIEAMTDEEASALIFAPGFSTATKVTDLSGRGVGMDVVRTSIQRLGGQVSVVSQPRVGTTVRFLLPFTVMMTRVMTVEAANQMFGLPMEAIRETVRIPRSAITLIGAAKAFVLRDRTVPLIDLGEALGGLGRPHSAEATIIVVEASGHIGGLEVDRLGDRLDVMLTAPDGLLAGVPGIDGTTLMGDGRVLIVLDLQAFLH
jgi:two-component system chemotaxis sensor kinase CheA